MVSLMFDYCLYFNTTALARVLDREWTKAFDPYGLTPAQAFMLRVILAKPGLLQRELAKELTISRSTATRTLDGLQEKGLIKREATKRDGREFALRPTAKANALKDKINTASGEVTKRVKRKLGVVQFDDIVAKLRGAQLTLK
jgi:DNA-binding MarR family transcriptional regulator